jgi:hypothetical protein
MNRRWQQKPILVPVAAVAPSKTSKKIAAPADKPAPSSKASKPLKGPASGDGNKED